MSFEPRNALEQSLVKAAKDPAHRPQFYEDFLASEIFIIQHGEPPPKEVKRVTISAPTKLQIQNIEHNGKPYIPIFTSLDRLRATLKREATFMGINAREFLNIVKGSAVLLNPGSDYGKEFTASEINSLLDGSVWKPTEQITFQKPTKVLFGQPKNYPKDLTDALSRLFATLPEVERAWLAHFFNPERDEKPHTLIGIEQSGNWDSVVGQAGVVARNVKIPDPPVDFTQVIKGGGEGLMQDYFLKDTAPFYKKKRLFGLFG